MQALMVCIGNICRSPLAEAEFRLRYPDWQVASAGLAALVHHPADPFAVSVGADVGIDLSAHRARLLSSTHVHDADLILVMTSGQLRDLLVRWPEVRGKAYRVGHWINRDVNDPYRHPREAFEQAHADIVAGLAAWQPYLKHFRV